MRKTTSISSANINNAQEELSQRRRARRDTRAHSYLCELCASARHFLSDGGDTNDVKTVIEDTLRGLEIVEAPQLRHFTARLRELPG